MLVGIVAVAISSILIWLLKYYIYGGVRKQQDRWDDIFPPEKEEQKPRRSFAQAKAEYEENKRKEQGVTDEPQKNFFAEAEEFISKRQAERNRKRQTLYKQNKRATN